MPSPRSSALRARALRSSLAALLVVLGSHVAAGCAPDAEAKPPPAAPPASAGQPARLVPAFAQPTTAPRFAWATRSAAPPKPLASIEERAMDAVRAAAPTLGLRADALGAAVVTNVRDRGARGALAVLEQSVGGVPVLHARLKLLFDRDGALVATGGALAPSVAMARGTPTLDAAGAVAIAGRALGVAVDRADVAATGRTRGLYEDFIASAFTSPARARAVLVEGAAGLEPAFEVEVTGRVAGVDAAWRHVVSAVSGRVLESADLVHHAPFTYRVWADEAGAHAPACGPQEDWAPHPTGLPDGSSPAFVSPSLVSIDGFNVHQDPWLPAGALVSTGNNVDAYTDGGDDGFGPGDLRASATGSTFDHTFDPTLDPLANDTQRMGAVTQGFYTVNWLHDDWYDAGFDEQAGNAQTSNLGRGGVEGDALHLEVQDDAPNSIDNANALVPGDGASPRIQIYLWSAKPGASSVTLGAQSFGTGVAAFGPKSFTFTGQLALGSDGVSIVGDACEPLVSDVVGKIALVDRGQCSFKQKALNAESAGAAGIVIANVAPGSAPFMPDGMGGAVTIPVLSVTQADGAVLAQSVLAAPTTVTMSAVGQPLRDGALDNLIVAHEWGHYLHLRLVECDTRQCGAEGEGWADFVALMLAVREGDDLLGTYSDAQYAAAGTSDDAPYFGTRRFPYSGNMAKNPLTFQHISEGVALPATAPINSDVTSPNQEIHAAGEVWASMLFDAYLALLGNAQGPNAPYTFAEARERMQSYVVTGMALAPSNPTYTEQRDALIAAALASDASDAALIAAAFAKRGAGTCAVAPPRTSEDFTGVVESFVITPSPAVISLAMVDDATSCDADGYLDGDESGHVAVEIANTSSLALTDATVTLASSDLAVSFPSGATAAVPALAPFASTTVSIPVARASKVKSLVEITATVASPSACGEPSSVMAPFAVSVDEAPADADAFEASETSWTLEGEGAAETWSLGSIGPTDRGFRGIDVSQLSDRSLVSPPISVAAGASLVIGFSHAWSFETSNDTFWDGGVIEISKDGGPWQDVTAHATLAYPGEITSTGDNPLAGRPAFVGESPSFPVPAPETLALGASFGGSTVRLRFRLATDTAAGAEGWIVDDVIVSGAAKPPFVGLVPDTCGSTPGATSSGATSSSTGGDGGGGGGPVDDDDGCGCFVAAEPSSVRPPLVALALSLAALGLRRIRRGRRARTHQQS